MNQASLGKKAPGYVAQLKNPRFLFYLNFFLDMVTTLSNLSLQLQRNALLVIDVPYLLEATKTKLLMLSVELGPYYKQLMEELIVDANGDVIQRRDSRTAKNSTEYNERCEDITRVQSDIRRMLREYSGRSR